MIKVCMERCDVWENVIALMRSEKDKTKTFVEKPNEE